LTSSTAVALAVAGVIFALRATMMYYLVLKPHGGLRALNRSRTSTDSPNESHGNWAKLAPVGKAWFFLVPGFYFAAMVLLVVVIAAMVAT
jgi:hypothetical protein